MSTPPEALTPLELARQRLQVYLDAEARILQSQEYTVGGGSTGRRNRRAELESVQRGITDLRDEIARLEACDTSRVSYLRPY